MPEVDFMNPRPVRQLKSPCSRLTEWIGLQQKSHTIGHGLSEQRVLQVMLSYNVAPPRQGGVCWLASLSTARPQVS